MSQDRHKDEKCERCGSSTTLSRSCGVRICDDDDCNGHNGLVRCYCGWAADGGNGYTQLREMGEQIEDDY